MFMRKCKLSGNLKFNYFHLELLYFYLPRHLEVNVVVVYIYIYIYTHRTNHTDHDSHVWPMVFISNLIGQTVCSVYADTHLPINVASVDATAGGTRAFPGGQRLTKGQRLCKGRVKVA